MDLSNLFPSEVAVTSATPEMWMTPAYPEEEVLITQAVAKRQQEFRAGRHCAHQAMTQLGIQPQPILRDAQRAPVWPEGLLGSISHCRDFCLAACATDVRLKGLGVDVEPLEPLKHGTRRYIQTDAETAFMQEQPQLPARLIFSAKESLYKCYHPLVRTFFGFHSVELEVDTGNQKFSFSTGIRAKVSFPDHLTFMGHYVVTRNHLITSCYLYSE